MFYEFDSKITHRRHEKTNNKEAGQKDFLKKNTIFVLADQDKITYGLGYILTLKRDNNNIVIYGTAAVAEAKVFTKNTVWYVEKFIPNFDDQQFIADQILSDIPTELYYEERTVSRKKIIKAGTWRCN